MAMSRQKKLDKMDIIELQSEKPKPSFDFKNQLVHQVALFSKPGFTDWLRPSTYQALKLHLWTQSKVAIIGANGIGKTTLWSLSWALFHNCWEVERGDYLELGYFEQEVEGGNRQTPLEAVWNAFQLSTKQKFIAALCPLWFDN